MTDRSSASAGKVIFEPSRVDVPEVRALYADFIAEADGPLGIDLADETLKGPPADLEPPGGVLLLVRAGDEPAGLGGVRHLDTDVAEVKSMYLSPAFRGQGIARRLLAELETIAGDRGCAAVRLDTSDYLTDAIGLYRAAGYRQVPDYNGNSKANLWFERPLAGEPQL